MNMVTPGLSWMTWAQFFSSNLRSDAKIPAFCLGHVRMSACLSLPTGRKQQAKGTATLNQAEISPSTITGSGNLVCFQWELIFTPV